MKLSPHTSTSRRSIYNLKLACSMSAPTSNSKHLVKCNRTMANAPVQSLNDKPIRTICLTNACFRASNSLIFAVACFCGKSSSGTLSLLALASELSKALQGLLPLCNCIKQRPYCIVQEQTAVFRHLCSGIRDISCGDIPRRGEGAASK